MKKPTCSEQLKEAQIKLWRVLDSFETDDIMKFVFERLEGDIDYLDGDIENEIDYLKYEAAFDEDKTLTRKNIKILRKNKQSRLKAMKELQKAYTNVKKIKNI